MTGTSRCDSMRRVTARALLLPLVLTSACGSSERAPSGGDAVVIEVPAEPPQPDTTAEAETSKSALVEPLMVRAIPGADAPGPVYLVINTKGVAKLDEHGVTLVLDKPERNVQDLFVGPDGAPYLVDARSLRKLEGERVTEVVRFGFDDVAPVDELAIAADGTIWVTGSRGVGHYHGGRWTVSSREQLGLGFNTDVAVAHDGTVWVAGSTKLLRRTADTTGQEWTTTDLSPLGRVPLLLGMTASPTGSVIATNGKQLIRLAGESPELTALAGAERIAYTADLSIAPDGTVVVASGGCDLVRLPPDGRGEAWRFGRDGYACETLEAMAIDGRRRIWVAAREGLSVIDERGGVVEYPAGSFPSLAGRVSHMVVLGRGPELPIAPELSKASLVGRIELDKAPLANAKLEACPTVQLLAEGSPCSAAKLRLTGSTDARGQFRLDGVPIGDYSFAVEIDGVWRWTSPPSFAAQLRAGEAHDLGTLALAKL
jgi:hypothetical protein